VRTYLDYNASAPMFAEVQSAVNAANLLANPSSVHGEGRVARAAVENARQQIAQLVGAPVGAVVFTSGGTEASNAVLCGITDGGTRVSRLLLSAVEHPCVTIGHDFAAEQVTWLPVDGAGAINFEALTAALKAASAAGERVLLSLQLANNETGVIQPLRAAADLVHTAGGLVHSDAVQAVGKIPVSLPMSGADVITLSAHKIGGPKGVGAIVFASEALRLERPFVAGGGQERGQRSGTENVAGIVGFGAAAALVSQRLGAMDDVATLRAKLEAGMRTLCPDVVIFGADAPRLPNTCAYAAPGMRSETALIAYDLDGVALSSGSACSSGKVRRSLVLDTMGVAPALAECAIRVSLGWGSSDDDVDCFLASFARRVDAVRIKQRSVAA
jgi:cysteine desulfurase